jgi:hypothetical protein
VTRPTGVARPQWCARPVAAPRQSRSLPMLWSTKHDKVFTYGIRATQGTRLAHLGLMAGDDGC